MDWNKKITIPKKVRGKFPGPKSEPMKSHIPRPRRYEVTVPVEPSPPDGMLVRYPELEQAVRDFVRVVQKHGITMKDLAIIFNQEAKQDVLLRVIPTEVFEVLRLVI